MINKKLLAAAALAAFAAPAFAQDPVTVTASQCTGAGGIVNQVAGTCTVPRGTFSGATGGAVVGQGALAGGAIAAAGGLLLVVALDSDDSTTTTTTTN